MKAFMKKFAGLVAVVAFTGAMAFVPTVAVSANSIQDGINSAQGTGVPTNLADGEGSIFKTVVNTLLFIIGAVSVIMLIYGGIRYTTSGGASASVTAAKNTIMYAIIGLIVAFLAFAVVNWVLVEVGKAT